MLVKLLFFSQLSALVSSQCMSFARRRELMKQVLPDKSTIMNNTRLVDCIDECLTDGIQTCKSIAFNPRRKTCNVINGFKPEKSKDTVVMTKLDCKQKIVDFQCFESITFRNQKMYYLHGIGTEEECRRICILLNDCRAYSWLQSSNRCGLQVTPSSRKHRLKYGEMSSRKQKHCNSNRCTVIKFNAIPWRPGKRLVVNSMSQCYLKFRQDYRLKIVEWRYENNVCNVHTRRLFSMYMSFKTILAIKQQHCKGKPDVCEEKILNTMMPGGFPISETDEQDCVTLCLHSVNCAAVIWSRDRICRFHHVMRKMSHKPNWTTFTIKKCSGDISINNVLSSECVWHGFQSVQETESPYCFKCAALCHIRKCTSFTCKGQQGQGHHDQCQLRFGDVTGQKLDKGK